MQLRWAVFISFMLGGIVVACASDQKRAPTADEVANGEALPPAPPVPAEPASTDSPATAPTPVVNAAAQKPTTTAPDSASKSPEQESLTEAQVAFFADLANASEVEQGKLAQTRAKTPAVKQFADMMVKHHTEAQQEQAKLFKKLNLTPTESASATTLKSGADKATTTLKEASAADFDRAYIASQVDAHQKVLQAIDEKLLPAARTAELQAGLRKMRETVEAHLSQAKTLQASK